MNRNVVLSLLLLLAALALWWSRPDPRPKPSPPAPAPVASKPVIPSPKIRETATPAPAKTRPAVDRVEPTPDPGATPEGAVPFRIVNGFVVAYGDILLGKPPRPEYPDSGFIAAPELHLWTNATIPFLIHPQLPNPERILRALKYLEANSPVRFTPYANEPDALFFMPFEGACLSYLGRSGGNQPIYLDTKCGTQEILHEILHALGFVHEHSRLDRDRYVAVDWGNVQPDKAMQFALIPATWNEALMNRPFDFQSVMLYPGDAFARDPARPTLQPRGGQTIAPVKNGLSAEDLERLNALYGGR